MNTILLFFAIPISTIILSIVLQKILKCPILVAGTFFAIFLIATYAVNSDLLIFAIAYTIISYITATITKIICGLKEKIARCCNNERINECQNTCLGNSGMCNNGSNSQARITLTTNQPNQVVFLSNRNNSCRKNCGCFRK